MALGAFAFFYLEPQNGWSWKGAPELIQSKPLLKQGHPERVAWDHISATCFAVKQPVSGEWTSICCVHFTDGLQLPPAMASSPFSPPCGFSSLSFILCKPVGVLHWPESRLRVPFPRYPSLESSICHSCHQHLCVRTDCNKTQTSRATSLLTRLFRRRRGKKKKEKKTQSL